MTRLMGNGDRFVFDSHLNDLVLCDKILQRRVPQNIKYRNVGARVDTGASTSRYERKIEELQTNYRYRKNELFKRIKVTTFAQLVLQVANISMQDDDASISEIATSRSEVSSISTLNGKRQSTELARGDDVTGEENEDPLPSSRSTLQSVIKGVGEADVSEKRNKKVSKPDDPTYLSQHYVDAPYLLLDVRDRDDYEHCHITTAVHFPIAMLSRTMNNFTRQILDYKNAFGKIIILYDEDERTATTAATTMVERGFDNIFVISGGLKVIAQKIPEGLVNGPLPRGIVPAYISKRLRSVRAQGEEDPACARAISDKKRFSSDDLDKINHYLDESLVPMDTGSRLSRQSKATLRSHMVSKASSMSTTGSMSGRRPWK